jgi:spore coat protein H
MAMPARLRSRIVVGILLLGSFLSLPVSALAIEPSVPGPTAALTSDDFFDQSVVRDIRLTMRASDWDLLREHFLEDTYYRADMAWQGQVVPIVGVRSRGSGSRNASKPGLKIDFGRYLDQKFLGMKSVALANAIQDPSMLKQRASMLFYTKMGVPAPRVAHVRVFVNDEYVGLYMLMEPIDKVFLARVFGTDESGNSLSSGYLYEYAWKAEYWFEYLGSDLQIYAELFEPKTHETDAPSVLYGALEQLFRDFNELPDGDFERVVGKELDLPKFVRYLAVETFVADHDSVIGAWGANNFYFYRFPTASPMQFIAWDKDLAFWAYDVDLFEGARGNVLARRALQQPGLYRLYLETLLACADAAMAPVSDDSPIGWLEAEILKEINQIHDAGLADTNKRFTNERFDDELGKVLAFARARAPYVVREVQKMLAEGRVFQ